MKLIVCNFSVSLKNKKQKKQQLKNRIVTLFRPYFSLFLFLKKIGSLLSGRAS